MKISIVSYINSYPFVYGIREHALIRGFEMHLCPPSGCARKLFKGDAEVGLVPVAALASLPDGYRVVTPYCIGAVNSVGSVLLLSNEPLHDIKKIFLDDHSLSSAKLVQVLARFYWNISPDFIPASITPDFVVNRGEAILAIGDKCFDMQYNYKHVLDLFDAWNDFTTLPFVFAVWVAAPNITDNQIDLLSEALLWGIYKKEEALKALLPISLSPKFDFFSNYLKTNISYNLDKHKQEAIPEFLSYIAALEK